MQRTRIGPFALEEPLDGLVHSNVLRGVHVERHMSMAIKLLPRNVGQQLMGPNTFSEDVKALQQLVHPGIVRCFGGAIEQGQPYLALEYVPGESLRQRLERSGKLPWEVAVDIVDAVCIALEYAHAQGFVHQRLTPDRILLAESGSMKITGFDCVWADRDEVLGLRSPMEVAHYLAPEQFRGKQSASLPTCDLFGVGVILFECLTGELPWTAYSPAKLVQLRRETDAPRVSTQVLDCPVWLDRLTSRLLARKRTERLASAEEAHRSIIDAKQKVASGMGAAQHDFSERQGTLAVDKDRSELRRLKASGRRKKDDSPFYERVWFLALSLVAIAGIGAWALWPLNEDELFAKALPLMDSDVQQDWKRAEQQYLSPLRQRYPNTKYADQIQEFDDRVAMHRAEKRVEVNERLNRRPQSESERHYGEAWRYEQIGDRLTAWQKYDALVNLFAESDDPNDRAYVHLAQRQIRQIKDDQGAGEDQSQFIRDQLDRATALDASGAPLEARRLLDSIISLYDGNRELQPLVERARQQVRALDSTDAQ